MIHFIKGKIVNKLPGKVVIENNGIGFIVYVSDTNPVYYAKEDQEICLYTIMAVKEDDISLYGFANENELEMYELLLTVSGIGNKGAMSIISKLGVDKLKQALIYEDADSIATANGIGKKTAQRLVLELKDKVPNQFNISPEKAVDSIVKGTNKEAALGALMNLGFSKSEAASSLVGIDADNMSVEEIIKLALKNKR